MTTSETPTISFEGAVIVLRVLQLIPKHGWTTAREIREILDADGIRLETRTMQRILKTLREHPEIFPLETELEGRTLRYRWSPSAKGFHLPVLSPQDMLLLRLAEEHLLFQLPSSVLAGLRPLFREARQLSSTAPHVKRECSWLQKVKVVSPALSFMPPRIRPLVFENVTQALYEDKVLSIDYRNAKGRLISARVMPLGLVQQDVRTYLVCRFEGYEDTRHLALHRIEQARVTVFSGERPEDFDLEDYTAKAPFNYAQGRTIHLEIFTDDPVLVRNLTETPFNRSQKILPDLTRKTGWKIEVDIEDSLLLDGWLAMRRSSIIETRKRLIASSGRPANPVTNAPDELAIENRQVVTRPLESD